MLRGVQWLHDSGVCHRDIKCSNLLLSLDHEILKVSDFGQMKWLTSHSARGLSGSPLWLAPEVIKGELDASGDMSDHCRADVWSMGCTVVEMVTGSSPWDDVVDSIPQALYRIATSNSPPPMGVRGSGKSGTSANIQKSGGWSANEEERREDLQVVQSFVDVCCAQSSATRPLPKMLLRHVWLSKYHQHYHHHQQQQHQQHQHYHHQHQQYEEQFFDEQEDVDDPYDDQEFHHNLQAVMGANNNDGTQHHQQQQQQQRQRSPSPELKYVKKNHEEYFHSTLPTEEFSGVLVYENGVPTQKYNGHDMDPELMHTLREHEYLNSEPTMEELQMFPITQGLEKNEEQQACNMTTMLPTNFFPAPDDNFSGVVVYEHGQQMKTFNERNATNNEKIQQIIINPSLAKPSVNVERTRQLVRVGRRSEDDVSGYFGPTIMAAHTLPSYMEDPSDLMTMESGHVPGLPGYQEEEDEKNEEDPYYGPFG